MFLEWEKLPDENIDPKNINTILEIDRGTGRVTNHLRKKFSSAELIASDLITRTPVFNEIIKSDADAPKKIIELTVNKIEQLYSSGNIRTEMGALVGTARK